MFLKRIILKDKLLILLETRDTLTEPDIVRLCLTWGASNRDQIMAEISRLAGQGIVSCGFDHRGYKCYRLATCRFCGKPIDLDDDDNEPTLDGSGLAIAHRECD